MLEPTTAERLMRLRALLMAAIASASDTTATGRHAAVTALDGVCELAMGLAAHELNVSLKDKEPFPAQLGKLRSNLGAKWEPAGVQAVTELHRARNDVQHFGLLPDPSHVPIWTNEVERFVFSLVRAAFAADLATVSASGAVEDEELRGLLQAADDSIATQDFQRSLRASHDAFDVALRRFTTTRGYRDSFRGQSFHEFEEFRAIKGTIERLDQYLDVAALAVDPGEWFWFEAIGRSSRGRGLGPTEEDAKRALAFCLNWVLRYESFVARYATARKQGPPEPQASPYEQYEKPVVVTIEATEGYRSPLRGTSVRVLVSHFPPQWDWDLQPAAKELEQSELPSLSLHSLGDWEQAAFGVHVPDGATADAVLTAIQAVIDKAHLRYENRLADRRQADADAENIAVSYREAIAAAGASERFTDVQVEPAFREGGHRVSVAVELPDDIEEVDLGPAMTAAATGETMTGATVRVWSGSMTFPNSTVPPDRVIETFDAGLAAAQEQATQRKNEEVERAAEDTKLVADMQALLSRRAEP